MNSHELMNIWRSQDLSPLYDVDRNKLHQMLRQERERLEALRRRARRFAYAVNAILLTATVLFFAILIDPHQPAAFSARLTVWDYVLGLAGIAAALTPAVILFRSRRARQAREQGFGDSLRDHLRRRIADIDAAVAGERRLALTMMGMVVLCGMVISTLAGRIKHVPVPWNGLVWPSPWKIVLMLGFTCLVFFRWMPRQSQRSLERKRQLETLLKELDG